MNAPLAGITILEANSDSCPLALRLSCSLAGRIASDLGATVIKIEPEGGDPVRKIPPFVGETGALFAFLNAGKRSVQLRAGADMQERLAGSVDAALIDDGIADFNNDRSPPIVTVVSFFGDRQRAVPFADEFTVLALSGLLDTIGDPARAPLKLAGYQTAYAAGLSAYAGLAAALFASATQRRKTHEVVRANLFDTSVWLNWKNLASASYFGKSPTRPGRSGTWQVVRCKDGWVALVYLDKDWTALKKLIADPRLDEARFVAEADRNRNAGEVGEIIEATFLRSTRREIEAQAKARRLPLGAVWSPVELKNDEHYLVREFLAQVRLPGGTETNIPRVPVRWSGVAFTPGPVPSVGDLEPAVPR